MLLPRLSVEMCIRDSRFPATHPVCTGTRRSLLQLHGAAVCTLSLRSFPRTSFPVREESRSSKRRPKQRAENHCRNYVHFRFLLGFVLCVRPLPVFISARAGKLCLRPRASTTSPHSCGPRGVSTVYRRCLLYTSCAISSSIQHAGHLFGSYCMALSSPLCYRLSMRKGKEQRPYNPHSLSSACVCLSLSLIHISVPCAPRPQNPIVRTLHVCTGCA